MGRVRADLRLLHLAEGRGPAGVVADLDLHPDREPRRHHHRVQRSVEELRTRRRVHAGAYLTQLDLPRVPRVGQRDVPRSFGADAWWEGGGSAAPGAHHVLASAVAA